MPSGLPSRALAVRVGERAADARARRRGRAPPARPSPPRGRAGGSLEIPAVDQLQRQEVAPARDAEVQHLRDVAVLEAHRDVRLVEQHVAELRIGRILREDPLEDDVLLEALGAVLDGEENLGHAAVGELSEDRVAAVRRHSRRLGYHPPTAGWRLTASESTRTTTTRAARDTRPLVKRGPRCRPPWAWRRRPRRRRWTSRTPCASCCPGGDRSLHGLLAGGADLVLEDGTTRPLDGDGALPDGLPFGYHRILRRGGDETLLIVSPGRCFLPDDLRTWGFAAQLYAARSRDSWGIGDLADLTRLGRWTREPGRRRADGQSSDGADAGAADRSQPLLPVEPALPQPAVPAHRAAAGVGRAAGRPARAPDERRDGAEPRPAHRPRRDLPPQAGGAGGAVRRASTASRASTGSAPARARR